MQKFNPTQETKIIIVFLVCLLAILIVLKIAVGNQQTKDQAAPITPSPIPTIPTNQDYATPLNQSTESQKQGEANFRESIDSEILKAYPLFYSIPYSTNDWSIDYSNKMEVTVRLKQDTPEIRQEVLTWITDYGVDPQSHKIIWKTL